MCSYRSLSSHTPCTGDISSHQVACAMGGRKLSDAKLTQLQVALSTKRQTTIWVELGMSAIMMDTTSIECATQHKTTRNKITQHFYYTKHCHHLTTEISTFEILLKVECFNWRLVPAAWLSGIFYQSNHLLK